MPVQTQEARIILAIEAIRTSKKMSIRRAAQAYSVPRTTLAARIQGRVAQPEKRHEQLKLTATEEQTLVQYIIDLDARGFPPRIARVSDMADLLLAARHGKPTGKQWVYRFVQRCPELKKRLSRAYDKQRALYEDPELINAWFRLVDNMCAKYAIDDADFYNFDETGFMMGVICSSMVVTGANREGRRKILQPGNQEWATVIKCISSNSFIIPLYLILQSKHHLTS